MFIHVLGTAGAPFQPSLCMQGVLMSDASMRELMFANGQDADWPIELATARGEVNRRLRMALHEGAFCRRKAAIHAFQTWHALAW
jgi:hypothetical protein